MRRTAVAVVAFIGVLAPTFVASAQAEITPDDVAAADAQRRAISAELETVTAEYDAAVAQLIELENSLIDLGVELANKERELATARVAAQDIAADRYMYAGSSQSVIMESITIHDVRIRTGYLDILSRVGTDTILRLFALEESYEAQQVVIQESLVSQEETKAELEELAASILTELESANSEYNAIVTAYEVQEEERRIREEEERRRREEAERRAREATSTTTTTAAVTTTTAGEATTTTLDPGATTTTTDPATTTTVPPTTTTQPPAGTMTCPVNGAVAFTDTWGAPRSGGRSHKGVDMIAARGTPVVAIEAGTVTRMRNGGLGGITVTFTGVSGDEYYYAHLDSWAPGLSTGQSFPVGGLLGTVGNTGNAQYTIPHLHFEHHPGGGSAVNPYPLVAGLCF